MYIYMVMPKPIFFLVEPFIVIDTMLMYILLCLQLHLGLHETIRLQRYFLWQFSLQGQAFGLLQNLHLTGCIWQSKPCTRAISPLKAT